MKPTKRYSVLEGADQIAGSLDNEAANVNDGSGAPDEAAPAPEPPARDPETGKVLEVGAGSPNAAFVHYYGEGSISPPPALIKNLLPKDGVTIIGGQSGAGKTFVVCNLAVSLASGADFFGRRVKETVGVAILAAEGAATLPIRLKVAGEAVVGDDPLPIAHTSIATNLMDKREVARVVEILQGIDQRFRDQFDVRLGAVFIDTVAAAFAFDDENSNSEVGKAIKNMAAIGSALGALVVAVHHFGKDASTGLRGGSNWRGGSESVLAVYVQRDEVNKVTKRELSLFKSRVGEEGPIAPFELQYVRVGDDEDGDPIGTCIVVPGQPSELAISVARAPKENPDNLAVTAFKKAFNDAMVAFGEDRSVQGDGPLVRMVKLSHVRDAFDRFYVADVSDEKGRASAVRTARNRARKDVLANRTYESGAWGGDEWIWQLT